MLCLSLQELAQTVQKTYNKALVKLKKKIGDLRTHLGHSVRHLMCQMLKKWHYTKKNYAKLKKRNANKNES